MSENKDREKAVEQAISQIERQFGKGSIMKMGEKKSLDIPSTILSEGDTIAVKKGRRDRVKDIVEANKERQIPNWMEKNLETMECQMVAPPNVEEIGYTIATNLIVEFYSR